MFGKKKPTIELNKLSSLIAESVALRGDITFVDGLHIDGRITGNVDCSGETKSLLILSNKGAIHGQVRVNDAVINGEIIGNVIVDNFLELQANARIKGDITYRQLRMECGASVDGKLLKLSDDENIRSATSSKIIDLASKNSHGA